MDHSEQEGFEVPSPIPSSQSGVRILHSFSQLVLLCFPAYLRFPRNQCAVEYNLVMDACRVITNASGSDVHLVQKQDGERVPNNTITLAPGDYLYCLDNTNTDYQVVTEFAAWRFPHGSLPPDWQLQRPQNVRETLDRRFQAASASGMSQTVRDTDQHCLITKYGTTTQNARLVPKDQADWFAVNDMARYCIGGSTGINNVANGITLRADVHLCLDRHDFVIRPAESCFKIHLVQNNHDYSALLHCRLVEIPDRVSIEFLYTRFAYTIINCLHAPSFILLKPVELSSPMQRAREARSEQKQTKKRKVGQILESVSNNDGVSESTVPAEEFYMDLDKRWRDRFVKQHPDMVEESDNPPETRNDRHIETPHMLMLKAKYFHENPQVWQSSATPPGSVRRDLEGDLLRLMDIQTKYN